MGCGVRSKRIDLFRSRPAEPTTCRGVPIDKQITYMNVRLKDLEANPFRKIKRYPIRRDKVDALKQSFERTGFWDNIVGRSNNGHFEIAYGHHRLIALKEHYGNNHQVGVIVRDLSDSDMLQIMAAENMEDAMVLSGCRIRSNLTDENERHQGGTRRQCNSNKERKVGESKANPHRN